MQEAPKMRTLSELAKEVKESDPGTYLTYHVLRRLVKNGTIPVVHVGNRTLVDASKLSIYLQGEPIKQELETGIRRVKG